MIDGYTIINLFSVLLAPLAVLANPAPTAVLPQGVDYVAQAAAYIFNGNFSTDPKQVFERSSTLSIEQAPLEVAIVGPTHRMRPGELGTYRVLVRNSGDDAARGGVLGVGYRDTIEYQAASPKPHEVSREESLSHLTWFLPDIIPRQLLTFEAQFRAGDVSEQLFANARYLFHDTSFVAGTTYTIPSISIAQAAGQLSIIKSAESVSAGVSWTITVTNTGDEPATNVVVNDTFPPNDLGVRSVPTMNPTIGTCGYNNIDRVIVNCSIPVLDPGQSVTIDIITCWNTVPSTDNFATAYADGIPTITSNTVTGTGTICPTPAPTAPPPSPSPTPPPSPSPAPSFTPPPPLPTSTPTPIPSKIPAVICDPSETDCTEFFPGLGVNFKNAVDQRTYVSICSENDPRECEERRPTLGRRFEEAVASIEPGECRVLEDDIVVDPAFHDAFIRETEPASFYLRPLWESGQDFKQLVQEASLDAIRHNITTRSRLYRMYRELWNKHEDAIQAVLDDDRSGADARSEIQGLFTQYQQQFIQTQQGFVPAFETIQQRRLDRYITVATQAAPNADASIQIACERDTGAGDRLEEYLETIVRPAYEQLLDDSTQRYEALQGQFMATGGPTDELWQTLLYPALNAWDGGNEEPLRRYMQSFSNLQVTFDKEYRRTYIAHADSDYAALEQFRLAQWEIALDPPKSEATNCIKDRDGIQGRRVETTICESGSYPASLARDASDSIKGNLGIVQPPDTSGLGDPYAADIDQTQIIGITCGGRPGDPFWAYDCSCKCGDVIVCPTTGEVTTCELCQHPTIPGASLVTRHDIHVSGQEASDGQPAVTPQEECLLDDGHEDPYL